MRTLLISLVALSAFAARRAEACTAPCADVSLEAQVFPSTVPAIPLHSAFDGNFTLTLFGPDGGALASSIGINTLIPAAPLEANAHYAVKFSGLHCTADGGASETFQTTDASPMPTAALGTVAVFNQTVGRFDARTGCGSCFQSVYAAKRVISLNVDDETLPFAEVVETTLKVDGAEYTRGRGLDGGAVQHTVFSRCRRDAVSGVDQGLDPGTHSAELSVTLAGGTTRTSAPFTFVLSCDGLCVRANTSCGLADEPCDAGSVEPVDAGPGGGFIDGGFVPHERDAGTDAGVTTPPAPSGCSTAPMGVLSMLVVLLINRRKN